MVEIPSGATFSGDVEAPPSKSLTHRAVLLAAMAATRVRVEAPLRSEDTSRLLEAVESMGHELTERSTGIEIGPATPPAGPVSIDCGAAGTLARLLIGILAATPGVWRLDGTARLRERPVGPLIAALGGLGARIRCLGEEGRLPVEIEGARLRGGGTTLDAGESSQYLSALLLAGLLAEAPVTVDVMRLTSAPYVELTLDAVRRFGGRIEARAGVGEGMPPRVARRYVVSPGLRAPERLRVEGDFSSACYFAAAASLAGGEVEISGLSAASAQGDARFLDVLASLGAEVGWRGERLVVKVGDGLHAVDVDMSSMPDQVPTLAALAPFAHGATRIRGVAHLRLKESDRLAAMATELTRAGAGASVRDDGLEIPGVWAAAAVPSHPVAVATHDDHRIAMSLAVLGLRRPGLRIRAPTVVDKSFPDFWERFLRMAGG